MKYAEDLPHLKSWICQLKSMIQKMKSDSAVKGGRIFFTIGNTAKPTQGLKPYTTPLREVANGLVCGVVVFTETQGILAASIANGQVDCIIVDAEKKIPLQPGIDEDIFNTLNIPIPSGINETSVRPQEFCNLSGSCATVITDSEFYEYKSNDMTVEGLWYYLSTALDGLNNRRVAIIGGGNIGFKVAMKLVESGCDVRFVRRDEIKGRALAEAANLIKPMATQACVTYTPDVVAAARGCDAVIGCTNGKAAIDCNVIKNMKNGSHLVDVGKGSASAEAVLLAVEKGLKVLRFDVTSAIDGMIATIERNRQVSLKIGRKSHSEGFSIVSGGYMGAEGDLVVDDFRNPKQIFGICDGHGDFKQSLTDIEKSILNKLKKNFKTQNSHCNN